MQSQGNLPLNNIEYDVVSILYQKSKALEAYDKFFKDAQSDPELVNLLKTIHREDSKHVEELKSCLQRLLQKKAS